MAKIQQGVDWIKVLFVTFTGSFAVFIVLMLLIIFFGKRI